MLFLFRLLLVLVLLYLFLIAPNILHRKVTRKALFPGIFAHRGLYDPDAGIPENSIAAFRRAVKMGFAVEMDLHLTRDGHLIVIHDNDAERMCGVKKRFSEMTLDEVRQLRLKETDEKVPTFDEVLEVIGGRVPLLLEMKSPPEEIRSTAIAEALNARMQDYHGPYCVESFNPLLLRWYKKHAPQVLRGQLAGDYRRRESKNLRLALLHFLRSHLLFDFISRPDFICYRHQSDRNISFRVLRSVFRPLLAAWTVRSKEEFNRLDPDYDGLIFESFIPNKDRKGE